MQNLFDAIIVPAMRRWSIPALRVALGVVFLWFGALKIFGVSPVKGLVMASYPFMPYPVFFIFLGAWEAAVGIAFILNRASRAAILLFFLQMLGTFGALILLPSLFFSHGNIFLLTTEGEFIIKNIVFIAASMAVAGYGMAPKKP